MKKGILVILGFCAITILLTWIWAEWGRVAYGRFLQEVAPPIYELIGFGNARVGAFRQRYINFVPFVGLMLVTPGLRLQRRVIGLVLGLIALFVGHLALNLTEVASPQSHLPFVPSLLSDALPFLVWVVAAYPALAKLLPSATPPPPASQESQASPTHDGTHADSATSREAPGDDDRAD